MLKLEVVLPHSCANLTQTFDVAPDLVDQTLFIRILLCDYCGLPFIPTKKNHRYCYDPRCAKYASRDRHASE